jgi:predicted O-methyltransferase YrrM
MIDITNALAIDGWMNRSELQWLARRAQNATTIVEIGSWRGRSTRALTDHCPGLVYAIDTWAGDPRDPQHTTTRAHYQEYAEIGSDGAFAQFCERHREAIEGNKLVPIRASSADGLRSLIERRKLVDMIFIDGCHVYEAVREDIELSLQLVKRGGILSGHDYLHRGHPGVKQAVDEAFPVFERLESIWWVTL